MKFTTLILCILSFFNTFSQSTYVWPSGQVNLPNPSAGFNPTTNLPNPPPSTKDTVISNGDTLYLALSKTGSTSTSINGGPMIWNMDITSGNLNFSQLTISLKQYAIGMKFCIDGMNCGATFVDKIVVLGITAAGEQISPVITGDSLIINDSTATTVCRNGEFVIGSIENRNAKINADKIASIDFGATAIKQVIIRFYNAGSVTPPAQSIGICDLQYSKVLSLNLLTFSSKQDENQVLLKWKTENEEDIERFEIAKSKDGKSFENIGSVNPRNNNQTNNYEFYDFKPNDGVNYYRLNVLNRNNSGEYSKILSQIFYNNSFQVKAYPNPLNIIENLQIKNISEIKELKIFNALGKSVDYKIFDDKIQFSLPGIYYLKFLTNQGTMKTEKVVVR